MSEHNQNQTAEEVINALQNCTNTFLDLLSAERDLLLNGDTDKLLETTENKQQILHELTSLENRLSPHIADLNEDNNSTGKADTSSIKIRQMWTEVVKLLQECQKISTENGILVNTLLKQSKNALNHLYSLCDVPNAVTYDRQGNQQVFTESNRSVHV